MTRWHRVDKGEYNEQTAVINGLTITLYSGWGGMFWSFYEGDDDDGGEHLRLSAKDEYSARAEVEHEVSNW